MTGALILVVGPSGAGKDTLLRLARDALADDPAFVFPRRLVTRPPSAAEDNREIDEAAFRAGEAQGHFALSWRAHGHAYALPAEIAALCASRTVVCNVSRKVVAQARGRFAQVGVVAVTAPPAVLAARVRTRGREEGDDLAVRLSRSVDVEPDLTIENVAAAEEGAARLVDFLRAFRREREPRLSTAAR